LPALALALAIAPALAVSSTDDESREAREAAARGEIVALEPLIADALKRHPGVVLEVELDDGEYEIEILGKDGRVAELVYAARSGQLLEIEIEEAEEDD
jgi:uncharacterized membrane protein YkoI